MKQTIKSILAFAAVLFCGGAWADTDELGLTPSMWYTFDENTSPIRNHGSLTTSDNIDVSSGEFVQVEGDNYAWKMGSSVIGLQAPDSGNVRPTTYLARINFNSQTYVDAVIWGTNGRAWNGIALVVNGNPTDGYTVKVHRHSGGNVGDVKISYTVPAEKQTGYHTYVVTVANATPSTFLYVDGVSVGSSNENWSMTQNGMTYLGQGGNGYSKAATGLLYDDFRFYTQVLTPVQVATIEGVPYAMYYNQLAGSETIPAGTYGAITIDESTGGYKATTYSSNSGLSGTGVGSFAAAGSTKNGRKMIDTHTIAGWFKVDALPTGAATKDIFVMRTGTDSYNGYKVVVDANGVLKIGRTNYNNGNYSWNDNKRVSLTGASGAVASGTWFHLAIACTYDGKDDTYWHLTPVAWINGVAAEKSGDDCIDINLNGPGYVDDIRIGANISAAGVYLSPMAYSSADVIKAIAVDSTYVRAANSVVRATLSENANFSEISWVGGVAPKAGDAAEITLEANVALTIDAAIAADSVKVIGTDKILTLSGSSLDATNFAKFDVSAMTGKVVFSENCTLIPATGPANGVVYRFEKNYSTGVSLPNSAGTYEFKNAKIDNRIDNGAVIVQVQDGDTLVVPAEGQNQSKDFSYKIFGGNVQIGTDAGSDSLWFGKTGISYEQFGGDVAVMAKGTNTAYDQWNGMLLGWSGALSKMNISGGTFTIANSALNFWSAPIALNVSGSGHVKAKGVFLGKNSGSSINLSGDAIFEIGSLNWSGIPLNLNGGTFKAYETATMGGAITVNGASTIEVENGATLTVTGAITGSSRDNKLTKTGVGTLVLGEKRPVLDVVAGKVRLTATSDELAAGRLVLDVPAGASQAGDDKVEVYNANGDQMTITSITLDEANQQVVIELQVNEPITTDCNISDKVTDSTTGVVLIQGSTGESDPITINFDLALNAYPQGVSFQVTGNVIFTGTVPTSIIAYETGSVVCVSASMTWAVPANVTAIIKGTISGDVSLSGAGTIKAADGAVVSGNLNVTGNKFTLEGDLTLGGTGDSHIKGLTGGKLIKTGSGYLKLNNGTGNGHDGYDKYAIDGTTIQIDAGMVKVYNENSDARMYNPTFVIGTNGRLENYGWIGAKGTLTIENETDKVIFTNTDSYNVGGKSAELWGGPNIVKKGAGKATLCVGSHTGNGAEAFGMVTVNGGILEFGGTVAADLTSVGAGSGMLNLKHTGAVTTIKESIITSLKSNEANVTFIGSGDNGAILDFGYSASNKIASHMIFDGGKHAVIAGKNSSSEAMSDTGSLSNPVILVKNGTSVKYVIKDQNGYNRSTLVKTAIVKVEKGGTLELMNPKAYNASWDNNTMFIQGRFVLEPGTTTTLDDRETTHGFKLDGADCGADHTDEAMFYIPSPAQDATGDEVVAVFEKAESGLSGITMRHDAAITVEERAIFRIDAPFAISNPLHKYGAGTLIVTDNSGSGVVTLHAGKIKSKTAFAANKIVPADPNKKVSASTEGEGENLLNVYTLAQRDATEIYPKTQSFDHFYLSDGTTEVTPIANDVIVIKNGIFNSDGRWKITLNHAVLSGRLFKVDYTGDDPGMTANSEIPSNFKIEIASGSCIYFRDGTCAINTGVVISGDGTLNLASNVIPVRGTVKITCPISRGTGSLQLSEGAQLVVENELASGVIGSGVDGKVIKKVVNDDTTITYSLVAASPDAPITPGEGEIVIPVVPVAGIAIEPGADVKVPTNTDPSKIDVVYVAEDGTKTQLKSSGYVTVSVDSTTGAINLEVTTDAKPAVTEMTETSVSEVSISFTPVPGLFYTLESGDTPDSFTPGDAEQATSSDTKTLQLSVPTGAAKVKFYRVRVKATK